MRRYHTISGNRISILVGASAVFMAAFALVLDADVDDSGLGGNVVMAGQKAVGGSSAKASASASASASSSSSAKSDGTKCHSESSSSARASADGKESYEEDHDSAYDEGNGCVARSDAKAKAQVGEKPSDKSSPDAE